MTIKLFSDKETNNNSLEEEPSMEDKLMQERLRQAKLSFNTSLGLILISGILSFSGIVLILTGKVPEGMTMTSGGLVSKVVIVRSMQLTKDTNDRLDKIAENRDDEEA